MKLTADLRKFLLLALFLVLPFLSFAFQEAGTAAQDSAQVKKPVPISLNRLVGEMEEVRSLINLNTKKIIPSARLKRIDSLYPVYKDLITDEGVKAEDFLTANPNKQKINNLVKRWEEYRVQLVGWQSEIKTYVDRNLRLLTSLDSESEVWDLTYERAMEEEIPGELLSNVRETINSLNAIEKETKDYNYTYLRLQTRINRLQQTVVEMIQSLYDKRDSETYNLFYHRHPPIWLPSPEKAPSGQELDSRPATLADPGVRTSELFQTHKEKLYFLLVLGLGLGAFIYYLRRQLVRTVGLEVASNRITVAILVAL